MTENRLQSSTRTVNKRLSDDEREFFLETWDEKWRFIFSPCVCTVVVNRLNAFSYDGIPKDGAFLTPVLHAPVPGQEIFCPPAVRDCHQGSDPRFWAAWREKRKFPPQYCGALAWRRARAGKLLHSGREVLAASRLPCPGLRRRMSPCQCLWCPEQWAATPVKPDQRAQADTR